MPYFLHRIFGWDFDGMSLEVRSNFFGCSYQHKDQLLHLWIPLLCSSQSSDAIVDLLLHSVPFSDQGDTS